MREQRRILKRHTWHETEKNKHQEAEKNKPQEQLLIGALYCILGLARGGRNKCSSVLVFFGIVFGVKT